MPYSKETMTELEICFAVVILFTYPTSNSLPILKMESLQKIMYLIAFNMYYQYYLYSTYHEKFVLKNILQ